MFSDLFSALEMYSIIRKFQESLDRSGCEVQDKEPIISVKRSQLFERFSCFQAFQRDLHQETVPIWASDVMFFSPFC